ncbi:MAG: efflux RND transporter permease subunit [Planctomycetia bacterium]|nr:efflux RND transporter permease subunit [Planctomycetia bacterium]
MVYNPTKFVQQSINEVYHTLFVAFILVFIVVVIFLQDWKSALLPMIDAVVSLDRHVRRHVSFRIFAQQPYTLFGLVLAIASVDDLSSLLRT